MKYWVYSEGNINGPYEIEQLAAFPSFSPSSLVCAEGSTGTNSDDWKIATEIPELAKFLNVGVVSTAPADREYSGGHSFPYESEKPGQDQSYSALLDTIDNILNAYKTEEAEPEKAKPQVKNDDFEIVDKFDIRIAKIQEDLEAARWEKNVLLERLRIKEDEERKDKQKIDELEKKLTDILRRLDNNEKVIYVEKDAEEKEKKEIEEKIEKIKRISAASPQAAEKGEAAGASLKAEERTEAVQEGGKDFSDLEVKKFSSLKKTESAAPERLVDRKEEKKEEDDMGITRRQLKSFGHEKPKKLFEETEGPAPVKKEEMKPLPMQESGLVYDFTVVTPKIEAKESDKVNFKIETRAEAQPREVSPFETGSHRSRPSLQQPQPAAQQPKPESAKPADFSFNASQPSPRKEEQPQPAPEAKPQPVRSETAMPGIMTTEAMKTTRIAEPKSSSEVAQDPQKTIRVAAGPALKAQDKKDDKNYPKGKSKAKFFITLAAFAVIAVGGIIYFFMGDNVEPADVALMGVRGGKKSVADAELGQAGPTGIPGRQGQEVQEAPPSPAVPSVSENVKKSIDTVKNYNLANGKGTISNWFSNSFSNNKQVNDEWSSTLLQGNVFVVQYRLIRQKQEPLVYQFEVDVEKGAINRGINNNAIELLESSSKPQGLSPKKSKQIVSRKIPKRKKELPLLPLPDEEKSEGISEPTGFENADSLNTGAVKITAPESDEELF